MPLSIKYSASIASYDLLPRELPLDYIYKSFGAETHFRVNLTNEQSIRRNKIYFYIIESIKTPDQLFNLCIDEVKIGIDIYETILRTGIPTVNIDSYRSRYCIYHALRYFIFFHDLMQTGRIKAVAVSHDCYVTKGLIAKIALRLNVPVFYANPYGIQRSFKRGGSVYWTDSGGM